MGESLARRNQGTIALWPAQLVPHPPFPEIYCGTTDLMRESSSPLLPYQTACTPLDAVIRSKDPFQIPKAGLEIAPAAGLASINVNGSVGAVPAGEFLGESTLGGMLVYAIYQALLTGLRTEAMRRRGQINRATQIQLVAQTVWASVKEGAAVSAVLAVVLLVFPWMAFPLSVLGLVGTGKATIDLFDAFWDGLSDDQRQELRTLAFHAGVLLGRIHPPLPI